MIGILKRRLFAFRISLPADIDIADLLGHVVEGQGNVNSQ